MHETGIKPFKLSENFKLGTATASLQIEGGDTNNNWYDWCQKGHVKDGSHCLRANDHYNRVGEDVALMKELRHSCYRMGLEWSRLEPKEGQFSEEAVRHYRQELTLLREAGIDPVITLFHFSYPLWFADSGAFEADTCIERFINYTRFCVVSFGDLCSEWIPINEPNVFAVIGYMGGQWPPGKKDTRLALKVMRNLACCHLEAYTLIHKIRTDKNWAGETRVGLAMHLRIFDPYGGSPLDWLASKMVAQMFQGALMHAMTSGVFTFPLKRGTPFGRGRFSDFTGINYYSRDRVKFTLKGGYKLSVTKDVSVNDLGWEIYPEGLSRLCRTYNKKYNLPIYITENGTCDAKDTFRAAYICDHLYELSGLIGEGIPVERYYYWTLMDNFEWIEGESARFGLIHCDFETQKRTIRESGRLFAEISENKALTQDMIDRYLSKPCVNHHQSS